jgi:hypothetical protein
MYLPLVPLIASVVGVLFVTARHVLGNSARNAWASVTIALIVAAAASVETRARNRDYASEESLWRDTVAKGPGNQRAHDLQPGDPVVATEHAGVLADSGDPAVRNPARALPIAEEAVSKGGVS